MTDDTISRAAALNIAHTLIIPGEEFHQNNQAIGNYTAELVKLPSAQPERKRGRWLPDNRPGGGFWVCSECKFPSEAFAADVLYKFCPNCGADMRGERDGH